MQEDQLLVEELEEIQDHGDNFNANLRSGSNVTNGDPEKAQLSNEDKPAIDIEA